MKYTVWYLDNDSVQGWYARRDPDLANRVGVGGDPQEALFNCIAANRKVGGEKMDIPSSDSVQPQSQPPIHEGAQQT